MHEIKGDLFASVRADAIAITVNGFVNSQGAATMGRGCAGEAKHRWPGLQMILGDLIRAKGNSVHVLTTDELVLSPGGAWRDQVLPYHLLSFPTKPDFCRHEELLGYYQRQHQPHSDGFPGWMAKSSLPLIEKGCKELVALADERSFQSIVLPRPGCGAGELSWEDEVRPLLDQILDDRFYVITFPPE